MLTHGDACLRMLTHERGGGRAVFFFLGLVQVANETSVQLQLVATNYTEALERMREARLFRVLVLLYLYICVSSYYCVYMVQGARH